MDPEERRSRLAAARVARLATVSADGEPHVVPVAFVLVDDVVYTAIDAKPKTTRRLRRLADVEATGRASVLVDVYDEDWSALWWVRADGAAEVLPSRVAAGAPGDRRAGGQVPAVRRGPSRRPGHRRAGRTVAVLGLRRLVTQARAQPVRRAGRPLLGHRPRARGRRTCGSMWVCTSVPARSAAIAASTSSATSCARSTVQLPGTSTVSDTNRCRPDSRVRRSAEVDVRGAQPVQDRGEAGEVLLGQRGVQQRGHGLRDEPVAGDEDVDADQRGHDRVEPLPAGQGHEQHADDDPDRGPHVGDQVLAVGGQRDRAVRADRPGSAASRPRR